MNKWWDIDKFYTNGGSSNLFDGLCDRYHCQWGSRRALQLHLAWGNHTITARHVFATKIEEDWLQLQGCNFYSHSNIAWRPLSWNCGVRFSIYRDCGWVFLVFTITLHLSCLVSLIMIGQAKPELQENSKQVQIKGIVPQHLIHSSSGDPQLIVQEHKKYPTILRNYLMKKRATIVVAIDPDMNLLG